MRSKIEEHRCLVKDLGSAEQTKSIILEHLKNQDSDFALFVLQFFLGYETLEPKDDETRFAEWPFPSAEFKFDIQGNFKDLDNVILHEGGECKLS